MNVITIHFTENFGGQTAAFEKVEHLTFENGEISFISEFKGIKDLYTYNLNDIEKFIINTQLV